MNSFSVNQYAVSPNRTKTSAGFAYFSGTGPAFRSCSECTFAAKMRQHTHCRKWMEMRHSSKPGPAIDASSDACKYFQARGN